MEYRCTKFIVTDLTFIFLCIVNIIPNYNLQVATFLDLFIYLFISITPKAILMAVVGKL